MHQEQIQAVSDLGDQGAGSMGIPIGEWLSTPPAAASLPNTACPPCSMWEPITGHSSTIQSISIQVIKSPHAALAQ
jgi:hypothetical protein